MLFIFLVVLMIINCHSVKLALNLQTVATVIKIIGILIIIIAGFVKMGKGW